LEKIFQAPKSDQNISLKFNIFKCFDLMENLAKKNSYTVLLKIILLGSRISYQSNRKKYEYEKIATEPRTSP